MKQAASQPALGGAKRERKQSLQPTKCSSPAATTPPEIDPCALNNKSTIPSSPPACLRVCCRACRACVCPHLPIHPSIHPSPSASPTFTYQGYLSGTLCLFLSPASLPNGFPPQEERDTHLDLTDLTYPSMFGTAN